MTRLALAGWWQYVLDGSLNGEKLRYFSRSRDRRRWRRIQVPSTFASIAPALATYDRAVWYAREVRVPAQWRGRRVVIRFEGANCHTKVWVNGRFAGGNDDAYLPFEFPVHGLLEFGTTNLIVVRVDAIHRLGELTGPRHTWQVGWRCDGGILRDVSLAARDFLHIHRVQIDAAPSAGGGRLNLTAFVKNDRRAGETPTVLATVLDGKGRRAARFASRPVKLNRGRTVAVRLGGTVPGAAPWSPRKPVLYTVVVECRLGGRAVDVCRLRTGFRRIETRGERLLLNGRPIYLTGFNRHEDSPRTGQAADMATTRRDLVAMKKAGCNFIRLCHYPHDPRELDLCDELGLLAMDEIPLYNWPGYGEGKGSYPKKVEAAKRFLKSMIARDRNHPSVIFWSVSNETDEARPEVVKANSRLLRLARRLDRTRLIVHVSFGVTARHHFEHDDVVCFNEYPAMNDLLSGRADPEGSFAGATRRFREVLRMLHRAYPGKPIFVTEFGCPSVTGQMACGMGEKTAARAIEADFAGMAFPFVCGSLIWCWADHPWPVPHQGFMNFDISPFGVCDRDRTRRLSFKAAARLFRKKQGEWKRGKGQGSGQG